MAASQETEKKEETKGTTLPELLNQQAHIMSVIAENGGELPKELEIMLDNITLTVAEKIDGYVMICERFEMESDFWKQKATQYSKLSKTADTIQKKIKERVKECMIATGATEIKGIERRYLLTDLEDAVDIDEALLSDDYKKKTIVMSPDKERIKQDLELGIEVLGASLRKVKSLRDYANAQEKNKSKKAK